MAKKSKDTEGNIIFFKLYFEDLRIMEECYSPEQIGMLVLALGDYAEFGETNRDLPPEVKPMYIAIANKIRGAQEKYAQICATNAANGAKGGRKKAENAAATGGGTSEVECVERKAPKFKPPTKTEYNNIISEFRKEDCIECTGYEADELYSELASSDWEYKGYKVSSRDNVKMIVAANFCSLDRECGRYVLDGLITTGHISEISLCDLEEIINCCEYKNDCPDHFELDGKRFPFSKDGAIELINEWFSDDE